MMSNYVIVVYMSSDPSTYMVHIRFVFQNRVWQPTGQREGEKERESTRARTQAVAGRLGPPVRRRGRARPGWAG
jgi:hypothetical protein